MRIGSLARRMGKCFVGSTLLLAVSSQHAKAQSSVAVFWNASTGTPALTYDGHTYFATPSVNANGNLSQSPLALAQAANGGAFVIATDASGIVWLNHYAFQAATWSGWVSPGGSLLANSPMSAAIAPNGVIWFSGVDVGYRFWIDSWDGTGFGLLDALCQRKL